MRGHAAGYELSVQFLTLLTSANDLSKFIASAGLRTLIADSSGLLSRESLAVIKVGWFARPQDDRY